MNIGYSDKQPQWVSTYELFDKLLAEKETDDLSCKLGLLGQVFHGIGVVSEV